MAERVLSANWTEGTRGAVPYAYTRPSPGRYPWQWYWDSCFAAIVWRRFDPDRSRAELESLLGACRADGFVGHTIFWDHPVSLTRRLFYNVASRRGDDDLDHPAAAPGLGVADRGRRPGRRARGSLAHHEWLRDNRDLEGDGLLWLVQPDESGLDSSPKFDPVWGWRAHARVGFPLLVARNRRLGWDARRVRDAGGPVLCEVVTNVLWGLARLAMGEPSITPALVDRLWDERLGMFCDEAQPGGARPAVETWAALAPLALPDLPESIGRRLVEEHLLDPKSLLAPRCSAVGLGGGAELRARARARAGAPLLARTDMGQRRLAPVDRDDPPRLPRGGRADGRNAHRGDRAARAFASTTTRAAAPAWAPPTSRGPRLAVEMADPDPQAAASYL